MTDRWRVIYDIERCVSHVPDACRDCSKHSGDLDFDPMLCMEDLLSDALALLREQEKTKVVFRQYDGSVESECGNCGLYLDKTYSVCPKCGKELDWNA